MAKCCHAHGILLAIYASMNNSVLRSEHLSVGRWFAQSSLLRSKPIYYDPFLTAPSIKIDPCPRLCVLSGAVYQGPVGISSWPKFRHKHVQRILPTFTPSRMVLFSRPYAGMPEELGHPFRGGLHPLAYGA